MNLPTHEQCLELFKTYVVPQNIKEHCLRVNVLSNFLAKKLQEASVPINLTLVDRGSLLHDLFKMAAIKNVTPTKMHPRSFSEDELAMRTKLRETYPGLFESQIAYEIFKDEFPALATVLKNEGDPNNRQKTWEESIIHYADMRMLKNDIVSLADRFAYARERYSGTSEYWDDYLAYALQEEAKIFQHLNIQPQDLKQALTREENNEQ
jgi:hypothetical protein